MMAMDVDLRQVLTSSVGVRDVEWKLKLYFERVFASFFIIKGPSSWSQDFGSSVTNTYLRSLIHFRPF